ncbi:MAG: antitoxin family protein [Candidatus Omnitrophica bacterium]|nr:antitoxin family protein [Candidatus Omnitrophota bacterium]
MSWRFLSCGDKLKTRIDLTIKQATQAIYENGVFRPLGKVDLAENSRVDLSFQQTEENDGPRRKLPLELQELIGSISPEDCDIMEKAIEEAFEQIDLDAWK